jgi:rRNA biogenesis protein RRP5
LQLVSVGQSVCAQVLKVKEDVDKFSLSLKQSVCFSTDASLVEGYFVEEEKLFELSTKSAGNAKDEWSEDLKIGTYVEGEIQDIKDCGVIMNLYRHKEIVGFLTHYQLSDAVEVGKKVTARVLNVVKADGIVGLTL